MSMTPSTPRFITPDRCANVSPIAAYRYGIASRTVECRMPSRVATVKNCCIASLEIGEPASRKHRYGCQLGHLRLHIRRQLRIRRALLGRAGGHSAATAPQGALL